jgi:hypothetical protein
MKIRDILTEDGDDSGSSNQGGRSGKSNKLHPNHKSAIKGMTTYPELPGWYYDMYRFGVDMAGSPDGDMDRTSATANQLVTLAYSDADAEIINRSRKNMGLKGKTLTSKDSREDADTNKKSAVATPKKNKYGI